MTRKMTVLQAKATTKPGRYSAGDTLYLHIGPTGSKSWVQRLLINGRRHDIGLGSFKLVSLAEARDLAYENRKLARQGGNPLEGKRKTKVPTFRQAAIKTYEALKPRWRNKKVADNWMQQLEKHALPRLGNIHIDRVGREDVLAVLGPVWTSKPETARRVRRGIKQTLGWAQAHGFVDQNVMELVSAALPAQPAVKQHMRALPYSELPEAIKIIKDSNSSMNVKAALQFLILTAARTSEVLHAHWDEVDLKQRLWTIPASRMKQNREHRQPLSDQAISVLESMQPLRDKSGLIFPSPARKGKPLSNMSMTKVLRDCGLADRAHVHGFRSSFRTWASEQTNADHAVMELCLAHVIGNAVEQAYARSDLLAKRRNLMDKWGRFMTVEGTAKIVKLHG